MPDYSSTGTITESPQHRPLSCQQPGRRMDFLSRGVRLLRKIGNYRRFLGAGLGLRWFFTRAVVRLPGASERVISVRPPALKYPVRVRMFPHSDDYVFDQVFIAREHAPLDDLKAPEFILDLGANVGYASALFASRYPSARILAVEPDPGNYQVCVENLRPYGDRVQVVLGAVWAYRSRLALSRGHCVDASDWAVQVHETSNDSEGDVEAWDVPGLLKLAGAREVDLAKIDIEGSEVDVFGSDTQWLSCVRNICIELHGDHCEEVFMNALRGYNYKRVQHGENTFCFNLKRAQP
jgi:FkbM family methyltransferase